MNLTLIFQICVPAIMMIVGGMWYHISTMNKVILLETQFEDLADQLESIEERLSASILRLEDKVDNLLYHKAPKKR